MLNIRVLHFRLFILLWRHNGGQRWGLAMRSLSNFFRIGLNYLPTKFHAYITSPFARLFPEQAVHLIEVFRIPWMAKQWGTSLCFWRNYEWLFPFKITNRIAKFRYLPILFFASTGKSLKFRNIKTRSHHLTPYKTPFLLDNHILP